MLYAVMLCYDKSVKYKVTKFAESKTASLVSTTLYIPSGLYSGKKDYLQFVHELPVDFKLITYNLHIYLSSCILPANGLQKVLNTLD